MASQLLQAVVGTALIVIVSTFMIRRLRNQQTIQAAKPDHKDLKGNSPEPSELCKSLASVLPDAVILPQDTAAFKQSMQSYWAQQECEVIPACVVRPHDVQELCTAVNFLKKEYDKRGKRGGKTKLDGSFAIRSGGHSPVPEAASIAAGVVIDLSLFCEVTPSKDASSVSIGAGAKWADVSKILDEKGLAVVGGRNSAVGVGGLTLGGTFFAFDVSTFPVAIFISI